jgi:hypothetical protein
MEDLRTDNQLIRGLQNNLIEMFNQLKGVEYDDIQTINTIEDFYILVGEFAKNELENLESYEDA